jgi:hypothetical protein
MEERNVVLVKYPRTRVEGSNVLEGLASDYTLMKIPFTLEHCKTLEEIKDLLVSLGNLHGHLAGSRGYCYDSHSMARLVGVAINKGMCYDPCMLTRSGGLRKRVLELCGFE